MKETSFEINVGDKLDYVEYGSNERMPVLIKRILFDGFVFLIVFNHEGSTVSGVTEHTNKLKKRVRTKDKNP
jgi:hypothetical protein